MNEHATITRAIGFIEQHVDDQPGLAEIAGAIGLSPFQCQRLFSRMVGVSPKKFLQYLTLQRAKAALEGAASVLDAAYEAGLSGPGRLHDLFITVEAATPGEFKARGAGMTIRHGVADSPFGPCLILANERGVTGLGFVEEAEIAAAVEELGAPYARARFVSDDGAAEAVAARIFAPLEGRAPSSQRELRLFMSGTPFQLKVWEALLRVPSGALVAYEDLARAIGRPDAPRAVGGAVAANPIAWIIPCHRVIRSTGVFGNYRWGIARKRAMIAAEGALAEARAA